MLRNYMGISISQYKDPYKPTSIMESRRFFFVTHILGVVMENREVFFMVRALLGGLWPVIS